MKVLQVNVLVDSGSTGKIVRDIDNVLVEKGIDSVICYGRKNTGNKARTFKFCTEYEAAFQKILNRLGLVTMYGGNYLSTQRLISKIKKEAPDIVISIASTAIASISIGSWTFLPNPGSRRW